MTQEQLRTINQVCEKLLKNEKNNCWGTFDNAIIHLQQLDDTFICNEAYALLEEHKSNHIYPDMDVPNPALLVPMIMESVASILEDFEKTTKLTDRYRYILEQYLAFHEIRWESVSIK